MSLLVYKTECAVALLLAKVNVKEEEKWKWKQYSSSNIGAPLFTKLNVQLLSCLQNSADLATQALDNWKYTTSVMFILKLFHLKHLI